MTSPERKIRWRPAEVASRLTQLGVNQEILRAGPVWGLRQAVQTTRHDPASFYGIMLWGKTVRHLRDRLVPNGWTIDNKSNYPTTVSPDGTTAIAVAAGDWRTGLRDETPSTRSEKGPATENIVRRNQMQFHDLFPSFPAGVQTWLLLHFFEEEKEEIRVELSLPSSIDGDGFVIEWRERLILDPVPFASSHGTQADDDDEQDLPIPVVRR